MRHRTLHVIVVVVAALLATAPATLTAQVRQAGGPGTFAALAAPAAEATSLAGTGGAFGAAPASSARHDARYTTAFAQAAGPRRSHTITGAIAGFVIGAGATYLILNQGGSTSVCDRDRNQDAIDASYCAGLYMAGGAVGAGIGALIGRRMGR